VSHPGFLEEQTKGQQTGGDARRRDAEHGLRVLGGFAAQITARPFG
jgi:hypothetical protein